MMWRYFHFSHPECGVYKRAVFKTGNKIVKTSSKWLRNFSYLQYCKIMFKINTSISLHASAKYNSVIGVWSTEFKEAEVRDEF